MSNRKRLNASEANKELAKFLREDIKKKIKNKTLVNTKYVVKTIAKPNSQDIKIYYDEMEIPETERKTLYCKLKKLYQGSFTVKEKTIYVSVSSNLNMLQHILSSNSNYS